MFPLLNLFFIIVFDCFDTTKRKGSSSHTTGSETASPVQSKETDVSQNRVEYWAFPANLKQYLLNRKIRVENLIFPKEVSKGLSFFTCPMLFCHLISICFITLRFIPVGWSFQSRHWRSNGLQNEDPALHAHKRHQRRRLGSCPGRYHSLKFNVEYLFHFYYFCLCFYC